MKWSAWEAHRAGKPNLPPGYRVELDADPLELRRPGGSLVAAFTIAAFTKKLTSDTEVGGQKITADEDDSRRNQAVPPLDTRRRYHQPR